MSRVQVLVATMHQKSGDYSLLKKMNIQTDTIVCNQCNRNEFEEFEWKGHNIKWLSFSEKGVGLNRNNALIRATGEYILFADDDMIYASDYEKKVVSAFRKYTKASVIAFNLKEPIVTRYVINKPEKVGYLNYLRYGTARIAVKLSDIKINGVFFNQCFGGGTEHCHGEDNLFLTECLKKGLKINAVPVYIAALIEERKSSWNNGYDEKYLRDQGILYRIISKYYWKLLCLQDIIRHKNQYGNENWTYYYKIMTNRSRRHK